MATVVGQKAPIETGRSRMTENTTAAETLTLEQFLGALALSGVERRAVANFEGAYLVVVALECAGTNPLRPLIQTPSQWEDSYGAYLDLMEALSQRIGAA